MKALLPLLLFLAGCSWVQYQPLATIDRSRPSELEHKTNGSNDQELFMVVQFSGGGTRAAALGYGVLEELQRQPYGASNLLREIDLTFGVSGGSILATYLGLHGATTLPKFEREFLKRNFQQQLLQQLFSTASWPRLLSPEYGRGDLLQEQLDTALFHGATFRDLWQGAGPAVIISATDMSQGSRLDFTQDFFNVLCLDLGALPLARAVAASSAVPIIFNPITLNNNGGRCGYRLPEELRRDLYSDPNKLQSQTRREYAQRLLRYEDSANRPYIHLLDGGLTDNLGLRALLDITEIHSDQTIRRRFLDRRVRKILVISVNAQNKIGSTIDRSATVPGLEAMVTAVIDIPIRQNSQESLRRFRAFVDGWNGDRKNPIEIYFVSLNLADLPPSALRTEVLNLPTSFYLPSSAIDKLKEAARRLLAQSKEYQRFKSAINPK